MKLEKPLVSIIIPVYNVQNYLEECMNSLLKQTYSNIEIIAVDDGSIDSSPEILKDYASKYDNIHIFIEEENRGQAVARNIALSKATGKYILFVDSDDYIELNTVECLVQLIEENNVDFVRFNAQSFSVEGEEIRQKEYNFNLFLKEEVVYTKSNFKNVYLSFSPSPVLYLFTRKLIEKHNIRFMENVIHEDELYSSDIFLYGESCIYIDQPFYNRRYRQGSTMTERSQEQLKYSFDSYVKIIDHYNHLLEKVNFDKNQKKFLAYRVNSLYIPLLDYKLDENYKKSKLSKIKKNKLYYTKAYKNYVRLQKFITILLKKVF